MCKDPFIEYLRQFGYNVIRLPRRDFHPLQILVAQGKDLVTLGDLATIIVPGRGAAIPPIKADEPTGRLSGQRTSELSIGIGLHILGSILGAMGGQSLGLDAKYQRAKTVAFEFSAVLKDSVQIAALDSFLGASDVNPSSRHVGTLLDADEIYVVTETIKSNEFTVGTKEQSGEEVALSVPEIQQVVGAKVRVAAAGSASTKITYQGSEQLAFGFQAVRLFYDEGRYTAFEPLASGRLAARDLDIPALPQRVKPFQSAGGFARFGAAKPSSGSDG